MEQTRCSGVSELNIVHSSLHCNIRQGGFFVRQEILNLNRGSDGVGSVTMYRNFIRTFGLDSAVVLSDFIRGYLWCEKNKTLEDNFFHWNKNNICNNLKFHPNRFFEALEIIYKSGLLKIKKNSPLI